MFLSNAQTTHTVNQVEVCLYVFRFKRRKNRFILQRESLEAEDLVC